jgi:hypothetical protein
MSDFSLKSVYVGGLHGCGFIPPARIGHPYARGGMDADRLRAALGL